MDNEATLRDISAARIQEWKNQLDMLTVYRDQLKTLLGFINGDIVVINENIRLEIASTRKIK